MAKRHSAPIGAFGAKPVAAPAAPATPAPGEPTKGLMARVSEAQWDRLTRYRFDKRLSLQALIIEALSEKLQRDGLEPL